MNIWNNNERSIAAERRDTFGGCIAALDSKQHALFVSAESMLRQTVQNKRLLSLFVVFI
jgi:hypothetical protein